MELKNAFIILIHIKELSLRTPHNRPLKQRLQLSEALGCSMLGNIQRVGVKRMRPDYPQWCPATGQGTSGINWDRGTSTYTQSKASLV